VTTDGHCAIHRDLRVHHEHGRRGTGHMGPDRRNRLDSDLDRLLDLRHRDREDGPGNHPDAERLGEPWRTHARIPQPAPTPGRRTLTQRIASNASSLSFDDHRVLALKEVLGAIGPRRDLRTATTAAADRDIARRATPLGQAVATTSDESGHALWQASERRALTLHRRATAGEAAPEDRAVDDALARAGCGAPLPAAVRRKMEDELGVSLDRVRVHTDPVAVRAARAIGAQAFTVGEDIFFADGAYDPESRTGRELLAHELGRSMED
jgi:hypothetical protein